MPGALQHLCSSPHELTEALASDEHGSKASSALGQILEAQLPLLTAPLCVAQ